jgi:PAS domain S-box-containing protein
MKEWISGLFSEQGFMPHIHCYLDRQSLVWTMFITNLLIGVAYLGISLTLWALIRKIKLPFNFVVLCFGVFIGACGLTHLLDVWTLWHPAYWIAALVSAITAAASVGTAIYLFRLRHSIYTIAEASKLAEQRRLDLEVLTETLESRVRERTLELEQSQNQLNFITNALPTFVAKLDRNNCYVFVNAAYEEAFGIKRENIIGHHVREILGEKFYAKAEPLMQKTLNGEKVRYENSITTINGETKHLDVYYVPEIDADGIVQGYVVLSHDITALKQSEDKLRFSEAKLKTILDSAPIGLCVADQNGHIEFLNQEGIKIWEGARYVDPNQYGEYQGWFLENEAERKITAHEWPLARAVIYGESIIGQRIRIKTFEGNEKFIINSAGPILGEDQKILGGVVAIQDITELRHYERQLLESETKFRLYTEAMPQMAFIADSSGNISYYNSRHFDYFGVKRGDMEGWAWMRSKVYHPDDFDRTVATWTHALKTGVPYEIEYRLKRYDGQYRWHLGRAFPIRDSSGAISSWVGTNTDIHEQKEAQENMMALQLETEAARKELYEFFMQAPVPLCVLLGPEQT